MIHLYDRATMARALTSNLDPRLETLLQQRIDALTIGPFDLTADTEFVIVQPGDTEDDIQRTVGFSPLVEPIDGIRFGDPGFHPFWDWLADHGGWFEMIVTFGSTFAYVLLIQDADDTQPELLSLCRAFA